MNKKILAGAILLAIAIYAGMQWQQKKVYQNEEYGFKIEYPSGLSIKNPESDEIVHLEAEKNREFNTQLTVYVYDISDFAEEISGIADTENRAFDEIGLNPESLEKKLGTEVRTEFVGDSPYGNYKVYIKRPGEDTGVMIFGVVGGSDDEDEAIFKRLVSSFEFTK